MVFLTLACLPDVDSYTPPGWILVSYQSVLFTWVGVAALLFWARFISAHVRSRLVTTPSERDLILVRYERVRRYHTLATFLVYLLGIFVFGWGWAVDDLWRWPSGQRLPAPEVMILAPFLVSLMGSWLCWFDADRACARANLADLEVASPADVQRQSVFASRWSYFLFQLRHKLALVCIPLALLIAQKELRRQFPDVWEEWQGVAQLVGLVAVGLLLVGMPWMIRLLLGLKPLPEGLLRDRLMATARRLDFRCSDILVWNTRQGMANAMVIGIVPWLRYVIFTDRLLDEFQGPEIEAVFGHEIGHIKHRHMQFYLVFLLLSMATLGIVVGVVLSLITGVPSTESAEVLAEASLIPASRQYLEIFPMMAVLLVYVVLVFGFLSRRCERQADIYGCRAVSCGETGCYEHSTETMPTSTPSYLCPRGILTFIQALEKVAFLNGISRDKPGFLQSWQHSTIAKRVEFLHSIIVQPEIEPRFQKRLSLLKWGSFFALSGVLVILLSAGWGSL